MVESEKYLEKKLSKAVEGRGGMSLKLPAIYFSGLPDRLILIPASPAIFAEVKTTGEKPRKLQLVVHKLLQRRGFKVYIIDSSEAIKKLIEDVERKRLT